MTAVVERFDLARVYVLQNALLSKVEVRVLSKDGAVGLLDGILIGIHPDDGTMDIQVDSGVYRNVPAYQPASLKTRITWQWPGAEHEWLAEMKGEVK